MAADRQEIAVQLRDWISRGAEGYTAGSKLPSTRELATAFEAAQNTVAEALRLLAAEGLLTVQDKKRAVVRSPDEGGATSEERLTAVTNELTSVQDELRQVRTQLTSVERRVADLLDGNQTE